ncbi:hypothetical protein [Saccharopolyspora shandongensis]|uniref:hypothetical protein n=1 Tax=Saccharopolyspora shandongensis TaxID=418495 RepID=UPI0033E5F72D
MPPALYTYLVADLRTGVILDELPLADVKLNRALGDTATFEGTWNLAVHATTSRRDPYELTMPARRAIYALRDGRPIWGGIIWTRRYESENRKVSISCSDWWSYFDHRKVLPALPENPPADHVARQSVQWSAEQNEIARRLVALAQQHAGSDIGIEFDSSSSGAFRDVTYAGHELVDVGEALRNLAKIDGGPDIMFDVGPLDDRGRPRRLLRIGDPLLGEQGSPHVFEHGGNVVSYTWPSDASKMVTRAFATGSGGEQAKPIAVAEDRDSLADDWPLLEADAGYNVADPNVLQAHANADQTAGRRPVVLPELVLRGDADPPIGTFDVGDDVRIVLPPDEFHRRGVDTRMRLIDLAFEPGEDTEKVTITVTGLLDDVA